MDPLGFALENFDAVGEYRTKDGSGPIDASGQLADGTKIDGVVGLRNALLKHPEYFVGTLTEKMLTYALGRPLEYYDMPVVRGIVQGAARNDYRFSSIISGIVGSEPFEMKKALDGEGPGVTTAAVRRLCSAGCYRGQVNVYLEEASAAAHLFAGFGRYAGVTFAGRDASRADPLKKTAAAGSPRMGFVYVPHGAIMDQWTPAAEGTGFEFSPDTEAAGAVSRSPQYRKRLGNRAADSTAVHSLSPTTWLSGVRPKPTQGVDAFAGITADQIAAQHIGQDTPLPSIELATEDHSALLGACDRDYGCIYMNTLSWRTHTTPMPMEINPRKAFERMFGQGGSPADRALRSQQDRSILDEITAEAGALKLKLGARDQATVSDYLESVREIERRIQRANFDPVHRWNCR